ncbi:3-hydroxybutyrate dehydrogenase [Helicobacter sp. 16-1353]|uniref:3-hydroxybutyrate dehydrogenase n=1 Tax=Helicobacter sp. 16-1353 TaxID=2004996 RepID=UPI000DCBFE27|nr:3-hydroxybutyrate dehydrogenase [Helicobacter sp. 16-1353]RAX52063.1 3-hydroxybutyrate dehydrogenase [Helicobacter sp. 16-1353]
MKDKVVIVTGSASGIGLSMAEKFFEKGAKVVLSDINTEALNKKVSEFNSSNVLGIKCDVSQEEEIKNLINTTKDKFGRVDVFVNNAGLQHVAMIEDFPVAKFDQMVAIMLRACFISTKYLFPIMKKQKFGRIINISSINGLIGFAGKVAYNACKHGIIGVTKVAALECARDGITVNAICPGYIATPLVLGQMADLGKTRGCSTEEALEQVLYPLIPQKQLIDVNDVAELACYLASDVAKHITGAAMVIDGGYTVQ